MPLTFKQAADQFNEIGVDDPTDRPALAEAWNDFTDALRTDGEITDTQYNCWPHPEDDEFVDDEDMVEWHLNAMGYGPTIASIPERTDGIDGWADGSTHWAVSIGDFTCEYSQGPACRYTPDIADILECLLDERPHADTFEEWADDLGYDTDSRSAERIYNLCVKQTAALEAAIKPADLEILETIIQER